MSVKIKFEETPQQFELLRALGSKDQSVSIKAQEAFAAAVAPVAQEVLSKAGRASMIYTDVPYDRDGDPVIPLDPDRSRSDKYMTVWSQNWAGGLGTNNPVGAEEFRFTPYNLTSAMSFDKKYARNHRLDIVSRRITWLLNEVLVMQERNAWIIVLKAVAEANTNSLSHVIAATTTNIFQIDDLNRLMTRVTRLNTALDDGTPSDFDSAGLTDLFVSPEIVEQIRAFAYQPMNTRAIPDTSESTAVPLPDSIREQVFRSAGMQEIYGVNIHNMNEFGVGKKYNALFDAQYTASTPSFSSASDEVLIGVDNSRETILRPIARDPESHATFDLQPDNQFPNRADKVGFWGSLDESRVVTDPRSLVAVVI